MEHGSDRFHESWVKMGEESPRRMTRRLWRAGPAGLLLLAAGCTAAGGSTAKRDDPLYGSNTTPTYQPAVPPNPVASQPPTVATSNQGGLQPPAPPAYKPQPPLTPAMPTSNAALAGGYQPLQGGQNLRIGGDNPPPAFAPPAQPVAGVTAVPPPGTTVQPASAPITVPPAGSTLDQAYAAVTAKQPLSYRMTFNSQTGEYIFQMTVPSKLNTAAVQHVEATSASPSDAIRRTLEQLPN
jgi:hypothetical protein